MKSGRNKYFIMIAVVLLFTCYPNIIKAQNDLKQEVNSYLKDLPFSMPAINLPQFADMIYNIKTYGADGSGHTMNTAAIQKAIDACSQAGGGIVIVPPGLWLTGPIELKSNVNFHLDRGAFVYFSPDHNDYPVIKKAGGEYIIAPPVYGFNLENIGITGTGLLDGTGTTWRPVKRMKVTESLWKTFLRSGGVTNSDSSMWWPSETARDGYKVFAMFRKEHRRPTNEDLLKVRDFLRPNLLVLQNCRKVLIDGITIQNSPAFALNPKGCEDLVIRDVKINNEYWAQNGDGIDIGNSKNVLLCKSTVTAGDDGICMKSSHDKNSNGVALQNIVIEDCVVYHAHGGFVTGSNTDGGMHNICVRNCDFVGTDVGLRFKSARDRGGLVDNIYIKNIFMRDIVNQAILFNTYYENAKENSNPVPVTDRTPIFKNIYIDSIYCVGAKEAASVIGLPEMPIQDIYISNSYFSADKGFRSEFAKNISIDNVQIMPQKGPVFVLEQSSGFKLNKIVYPETAKDFMTLSGNKTKSVTIEKTVLKNPEDQIKFKSGVDRNDVIIK